MRSSSGRAAVIDLAGVKSSDSSGLALLIEWLSVAKNARRTVRYENIPSQLHQLARLSDVDELLPWADRASMGRLRRSYVWAGFRAPTALRACSRRRAQRACPHPGRPRLLGHLAGPTRVGAALQDTHRARRRTGRRHCCRVSSSGSREARVSTR